MLSANGPSLHLSWEELACNDGTPYPDKWRRRRACILAAVFEGLREAVGLPLYVNSAYRTPEWNRAEGGSRYSQHKFGRAMDLWTPRRFTLAGFHAVAYDYAQSDSRVGGLGYYQWGVHIDIRPRMGRGRYAAWGIREELT